MQIHVEFYGIPRLRAGTASTTVTVDRDGMSLGDLLQQLATDLPAFGADCVENRRLKNGFTANLDGDRFVTAHDTQLCAGQSVLILSTDAGG